MSLCLWNVNFTEFLNFSPIPLVGIGNIELILFFSGKPIVPVFACIQPCDGGLPYVLLPFMDSR